MKCKQARRLISDEMDGTLDTESRISLETHLEGCPGCRKLYKDFKTLTSEAGSLKTFAPPARTWFEIQKRLKAREEGVQRPASVFFPGRLRLVFGALAVTAVVVFVGVFGLRYLRSPYQEDQGKNGQYALAKLKEAEQHYQMASQALWEAFAAQEKDLDPQVLEVFQKNLAIIDASLAACRQVVLEDPENFETRNDLLAVYREKIDLLNNLITLQDRTSWRGEITSSL